MRKLSRGALAAIAAAVAVPAGVAIAHNFERGGWKQLSPEARARLDEGRLAMAKTALKLNPDQEKLWAPVETSIRAGFKARSEHMAERQKMREERQKEGEADKDAKQTQKMPDIAERMEKMSQRMSERADQMKTFATAFKPFYASLSDEQKEVLRPLMREMMGGRGGGRHGHGGPRWAMGGGWGEGGRGWGHHGGGHGGRHGHGGRGGEDGPGFRDDRGGGGPGAEDGERGPPAEQLMPEPDEGNPVAPDKL